MAQTCKMLSLRYSNVFRIFIWNSDGNALIRKLQQYLQLHFPFKNKDDNTTTLWTALGSVDFRVVDTEALGVNLGGGEIPLVTLGVRIQDFDAFHRTMMGILVDQLTMEQKTEYISGIDEIRTLLQRAGDGTIDAEFASAVAKITKHEGMTTEVTHGFDVPHCR